MTNSSSTESSIRTSTTINDHDNIDITNNNSSQRGDDEEKQLSELRVDSNGESSHNSDGGENRQDADSVNDEQIEEDAGDGTTAHQQILHGIPLLLCSLSLLLSMFLVALDQTIIVTLLETVGNEFGDFGKISWISAGFLLPTAVLAMNWGKISQIFGRKYTMLVAIVLFEAGSLVCALANSMNMLIGGRVLAGVGGGGIQVMVFVILTEITTIQKRGMFQGLVGAAFGIASVLGPLVGGAFTEHVTWRWCFYINLPIGGVAWICIFIFFRPPRPAGSLREKLLKIDYLGTALLCGGLVLVLLALTFGSTQDPWNSAIVIAFFVVGGLLLIAFGVWNFTWSKNPLLPWVVVKHFRVDVVCLAMFALFGAFMAAVLYLSTYFQVVLDANAMHSGIDLLPMIIPVVICSIAGGIFISKTGITKPVALVAGVCGCIGFGLLTLLDQHSSVSQRIGYLILPGIGIGLSFQSFTLNLQTAAPKNAGGVLIATAMLSFARTLGGVVGSALGQTIQSVVFKQELIKNNFPASENIEMLVNSPGAIRQLPVNLQNIVLESFVTGFRAVMYFALGLYIFTFLTTLLFTNRRIPKTNLGAGGPPVSAAPSSEKSSGSGSGDHSPATENNDNNNSSTSPVRADQQQSRAEQQV